jgi:polygalacturonase
MKSVLLAAAALLLAEAGAAAAPSTASLSPAAARAGASVLASAPADPHAVTVKAAGDGRTDDTDAIQQAIDAARDKTGHGIVFLPSGRDRLTPTVLVRPGVTSTVRGRR